MLQNAQQQRRRLQALHDVSLCAHSATSWTGLIVAF